MTGRFPEWLSQQMFRQLHARNLIYNACWEDPRCDRAALDIRPGQNVLVITSAGCNALDYMLDEPAHVYAVDMNPRQNALLDLKIAAIKTLGFEQFFEMFGAGRLDEPERVYSQRLREYLQKPSRDFWDQRIHYFDGGRFFKTFYFRGTTGLFARCINVYINLRRTREAIEAVFEMESEKDRHEAYHRYIKERLWTGGIRRLLGHDATLSLLGVPRAQRAQIERTYAGGVVQFIEDALDAVFTRVSTNDNYFWWLYLFGYYTHERCPEYLKEHNFDRLKAGLVERISTHTATIEEFLRASREPIHRFVLLDHMDWLATHAQPMLQAEWQAIADRAAPGARIVWRSAATEVDYVDSIPIEIDGTPARVGQVLDYRDGLARALHARDRVHTYGSFYVAEWKAA